MKKFVLTALLCTALLFSFACGSTTRNYTITTKDGNKYFATSEPQMSNASEVVTFEDPDGRRVTIPKSNIESIVEHEKK
jgi:ABC-type Fe3+-hydroxamate transport system substrate-binding protein